MTSPYLRIVPRTIEQVQAREKPNFALSRSALPEKPIERIRTDARYRDLQRTRNPASWENIIGEGLAWAFVMGAIIVLTHL